MRVLAAAVLGVVLMTVQVGCDKQTRGRTQVGARFGYGNGYAPATVSRGSSTSIGIHNYGGAISKTIAMILKSPAGKTSKSTSCFEGHYYEYCKTTTVHQAPSQAQLNAFMAGEGGDILSGSQQVDTHFEIASSALGGTLSGYEARIYFTPAFLRSGNFHVSYGYAFGSYEVVDRTWKDLDIDGMNIVRGDNSGDFDHTIAGIPVRLTYFKGAASSISLVIDNNLWGHFSDGGRSLSHLSWTFWPSSSAYMTARVSSETFSPDNATAALEVGFAY